MPRTRLSFGDRAFSVTGPRAWNSLPIHTCSLCPVNVHFEKTFKYFFIPACVFLTCIRVSTLSGVFVAFFCVRRLKFVFFTLRYNHRERGVVVVPQNNSGTATVPQGEWNCGSAKVPQRTWYCGSATVWFCGSAMKHTERGTVSLPRRGTVAWPQDHRAWYCGSDRVGRVKSL